MNKLEKVAIRYARKNGRPLVLAFNSTSFFLPRTKADEEIFTCSQIHQKDMGYYINFKPERKLGLKV
jgi:hypothetical protein